MSDLYDMQFPLAEVATLKLARPVAEYTDQQLGWIRTILEEFKRVDRNMYARKEEQE